MRQGTYYHALPRDYFNNLYPRVIEKLTKGENVLVSAMYGCGGKTFLNFFLRLAEENNLFDQILYFDPEIESSNLVDFVKKQIGAYSQMLVIIRHFDMVEDKINTLEKLNRLRQPRPDNLTYLVITNHKGILNPNDYFAQSSTFFSSQYQIEPFSFKQAKQMIQITANYYGWTISPTQYSKIFSLSGGIPRLIKHICKDLAEKNIKLGNINKLLQNPSILFQVNFITVLITTLSNPQLELLGIINEKSEILSHLTEQYFKNFQSQLVKELYPNLTNSEKKVFTYLHQNQNKLVSLDKLGDLMEMNGYNYSLWAIYKLISRLKPKIGKHFDIINVKGRGYYLKDAPD
ncbi:helix-turn-helix domain-containing protein [Patescibacteria group bacterium]|nr:helix-turn-helix domain-containing protein [Patescibacteria group bacterium]